MCGWGMLIGSSQITSLPTTFPLSINTGDVALRGGGTICNDFRFLRFDARVAMYHFDSTTGVVTGDLDLGVGEIGDTLPDLRLPARRVITISQFPLNE
jgi:hypothetical protein